MDSLTVSDHQAHAPTLVADSAAFPLMTHLSTGSVQLSRSTSSQIIPASTVTTISTSFDSQLDPAEVPRSELVSRTLVPRLPVPGKPTAKTKPPTSVHIQDEVPRNQDSLEEIEAFRQATELLRRKGFDPENKSINRSEALLWATSGGHEIAARLLLEKGADIAVKDVSGRTALHRAADRGHEAVVRLLLEKGADIAAKDRFERTALHRGADGGHQAVVRLLLEKGADIAVKDNSGVTALYRAVDRGHKAVVNLL